MKVIIRLLSTIIITVATSGRTFGSPSFDLNGIKLGQSYVEAKSQLHNINASYKLNEVKTTDGEEIGFTAKVQNADLTLGDDFAVQQLASGKVWYIGSMHNLAQGQRIDRGVFTKSIFDKYGVTYIGSGGAASVIPGAAQIEMIWQYNRQGMLTKLAYPDTWCISGFGGPVLPGARSLFTPERFNSKCGSVVVVRGWLQGQFVSSYSVVIIDHASMYDQLQQRSGAEQTKKKNAVDAEKSKGAKPIL